MRKIITGITAGLLAISLSACAPAPKAPESSAAAPKTVTVRGTNGADIFDVQVPYNPSRVAILEMGVLDMMDSWGLGSQVVGVPKSAKIDYLSSYNANKDIANLGTLKEVDMEALMESRPDVIFIGGRLGGEYENLSKIAPVVYLPLDYSKGYLAQLKTNVEQIASIFGKQDKAAEQLVGFESRIASLKKTVKGKTMLAGMVTSANFNTMSDESSSGSLLGTDLGFVNQATDVEATHGDSASFELLVEKNPDYIFVIDRDSAINAEGAQTAKEVMDNELVRQTSAHKGDRIVYLNPSVWYLVSGGITATDVMLKDIEEGI